MQVTITLTSPIIREENMREGGWKAIKHSTFLLTFFFPPTYLLFKMALSPRRQHAGITNEFGRLDLCSKQFCFRSFLRK